MRGDHLPVGLPPLLEPAESNEPDDDTDSAEPGVGVDDAVDDESGLSTAAPGTGSTSGGTAGRARPLPNPVPACTVAVPAGVDDATARLLCAKTAANAAAPLLRGCGSG